MAPWARWVQFRRTPRKLRMCLRLAGGREGAEFPELLENRHLLAGGHELAEFPENLEYGHDLAGGLPIAENKMTQQVCSNFLLRSDYCEQHLHPLQQKLSCEYESSYSGVGNIKVYRKTAKNDQNIFHFFQRFS